LALLTTGATLPYQLPLRFLNEPAGWRSTTSPYQLPLMLLLVKFELAAVCGGPPPASRNRIPTAQLFVIWFSVTVVLSVWLRKKRPVRLSSTTLLWIELPFELFTSMALRLPTKRQSCTSKFAVSP
jgi:hypothetical protein